MPKKRAGGKAAGGQKKKKKAFDWQYYGDSSFAPSAKFAKKGSSAKKERAAAQRSSWGSAAGRNAAKAQGNGAREAQSYDQAEAEGEGEDEEGDEGEEGEEGGEGGEGGSGSDDDDDVSAYDKLMASLSSSGMLQAGRFTDLMRERRREESGVGPDDDEEDDDDDDAGEGEYESEEGSDEEGVGGGGGKRRKPTGDQEEEGDEEDEEDEGKDAQEEYEDDEEDEDEEEEAVDGDGESQAQDYFPARFAEAAAVVGAGGVSAAAGLGLGQGQGEAARAKYVATRGVIAGFDMAVSGGGAAAVDPPTGSGASGLSGFPVLERVASRHVKGHGATLTDVQQLVLGQASTYRDVLFTGRSPDHAAALRQMYTLHIANHIRKTKGLVQHNNQALLKASLRKQKEKAAAKEAAAAAKAAAKAAGGGGGDRAESEQTEAEAEEEEEEAEIAMGSTVKDDDQSKHHRDSGFTRPRVLVLVPTRASALRIMNNLLPLLADETHFKSRFTGEYGMPKDDDDDDDEGIVGRPVRPSRAKPADWDELFQGNSDDCFKIGVAVTRKAVKLYSGFYEADIIVASPLGLRLITGAPEEDPAKRDTDFLSSIELVVVDQTEALLMQNWDLTKDIFSILNLIPKVSHLSVTR